MLYSLKAYKRHKKNTPEFLKHFIWKLLSFHWNLQRQFSKFPMPYFCPPAMTDDVDTCPLAPLCDQSGPTCIRESHYHQNGNPRAAPQHLHPQLPVVTAAHFLTLLIRAMSTQFSGGPRGVPGLESYREWCLWWYLTLFTRRSFD